MYAGGPWYMFAGEPWHMYAVGPWMYAGEPWYMFAGEPWHMYAGNLGTLYMFVGDHGTCMQTMVHCTYTYAGGPWYMCGVRVLVAPIMRLTGLIFKHSFREMVLSSSV